MYSKFCTINQLKDILNSEKEIKGFNISITQTATFEILIWIENYELEDRINNYIEEKTSNLEYEDDQRFIEKIEFIIDEEVDEDNELKEDLLKHKIETSIYPHLNSWIGKKRGEKLNINAPIITFYSYKGGVGRSTALSIVARQLSEVYDKKVAILDFDVEAPGQYYLFKSESAAKYGIIDYLRHQLHLERDLSEEELKNYYTEINKDKGQIYLFNTYGSSKNYLDKVAYVDFDMFVRSKRNYVDVLLKNIDEMVKPDVILIDSRTGFSEISGIFINNSDLVNVFLGFSGQNDFGIETILENYIRNSKKPVYAPNYIFNYSVLPEEKSEEDYEKSRNTLIDRTYQIMRKVFGERLHDPDFGENALNFNFIYRHKLLENNSSKNLDDFTAIDSFELGTENENFENIMNKYKDMIISQFFNGKSREFKLVKNDDVEEYKLIWEKIIQLMNIKSNDTVIELKKDDIRIILNEIDYETEFDEIKKDSNSKEQVNSIKDRTFDIISIIAKRTFESSKHLENLIMKNNESLIKMLDDDLKNSKINTYSLAFLAMIGSRLNYDSIVSTDTGQWFYDYFSDSNEIISLIDIISFFKKIKEICIKNVDKYYDEINCRIFPMKLVCNKEIYHSIAEEKLERLCKKYEKENLCNVIKAIKATKEIEFPINSYEFVVKVGKSIIGEEKNEVGMEHVDLLIELGVLEKKNEELNMKPIYLEAFGKRSSKYIFK
jgi:uncharacterized protein YktA (UPF0223 family)